MVLSGGDRLLEAIQHLGGLDSARGPTQQRGHGGFTLCASCNNDSGRWYGGAFVEWSRQALAQLLRQPHQPQIICGFRVHPLRVIKQIVCMFFSVNGEQFREAHPELVQFVLDRRRTGIAPRYAIYVGLNTSLRARFLGVSAAIGADISVVSEIAFPPAAYQITFDSPPPDARLVDVTFMARFHYDDERDISLPLPVLDVYTPFPGDFRDRETVLREGSR